MVRGRFDEGPRLFILLHLCCGLRPEYPQLGSGRLSRTEVIVRAAGALECLQMPPPKVAMVYFLLVEDEWELLQATIFQSIYHPYKDLHHHGAFLLEGVVEQDKRRVFSFPVECIEELREILVGKKILSRRPCRHRERSSKQSEKAVARILKPVSWGW